LYFVNSEVEEEGVEEVTAMSRSRGGREVEGNC